MRYDTYNDFVGAVESRIRDAVRTNSPRSWQENQISYDLATGIRAALNGAWIDGMDRPFRVECDVFKVTGKVETQHGDLAVLVEFNTWAGEKLVGVGFLEAKKRARKSGEYDGVDVAQLKRISKNTPYAQLLLYSFEDITDFGDNLRALAPGRWTHAPLYSGSSCQAAVLPLNTALALKSKTTSLHKFAIPLSLQLCGRFLRGLDLHYDDDVINAVIGYAQNNFGAPPTYVVTIGVANGDRELTREIGPNHDLYEAL